MAKYSDVNEGVDGLVRIMLFATIGDLLWPYGVHDSKSAEAFVAKERSCRFVSCWSLNPESHAMWAMYSPDLCAVKLHTTIDKLVDIARTAVSKAFVAASNSDEDVLPLICDARVDRVEYVNVHALLKRLAKRKALGQRLIKRSSWTPDLLGAAVRRHRTTKSYQQFMDAGFLKDQAYSYEDEVRLTLRAGRLHATHIRDAQVALDRANASERVADQDGWLRAARNALRSHAPNAETLPLPVTLPDNFVVAVTVDPRAPEHKRKFIESYFERLGIPVRRSTSFGAAFSDLPAYPDAKH